MLKAAAFALTLLPLTLTAAQAAAIGDPRSQCNLMIGVGFTAQDKIAACDTAIKSGNLQGEAMARALAERGTGYIVAGQFEPALRDIDDALARLDAGNLPSTYRLAIVNARGYVYLQLLRPARALSDFETVLRQTSSFAEAFIGRAQALTQLHLAAAALDDSATAVTLSPNLPDGYMARAEAHYVMGDFTQSIPDFDMAVQLDPTRYEFWAGRGQAYLETAHFAWAIRDLEQAQRLKPGDADVQKALDAAKAADAERAARIATAPPVDLSVDGPSRPISQTRDCTLLDKVEAISETGTVQIGYDVAPDGTMTNVVVAQTSGFSGLDQSAVDCVSQLWRNLPAVQGGVAVASPGHRANIAFTFDVDPTEGPAKASDYLCRQAQARGLYDAAIATCTKAIALDPKSADYLEHRGLVYYALHRYGDARADFEAALRLDPKRASAIDERDLAKQMAAAIAPPTKPHRTSGQAI